MRLIHCKDQGGYSQAEFFGGDIPPYAILSHTWGADGDEVTFKDLMDDTGKGKPGYNKLAFCAKQAAIDGLKYFWVDTCSIDKSSSAELQEAITSMFRWYRNAAKCYVYLVDVSSNGHDPTSQSWEPAFRKSRWFTRGWTVQELIAPPLVEFYSSDGKLLGDKKSLERQVHEITGIAVQALQGSALSGFSVAERLSWAEARRTKREEDKAYSLLGIFDIHMPLFYGEGMESAFGRLQEETERRLKNRGFKDSSNAPMTAELPQSKSFFVPFPRDPDFVDRGTLLDAISEKCSVPGSRTALVGLGGVGKSQLSIEYAYRIRERSAKTRVFWVHASNAARFEQSYRDIADYLQISGRENSNANIFKLIHDWLLDEDNGRWVLILDNVDDAGFLLAVNRTGDGRNLRPLQTYVPRSQSGSVLVTTRTREAASKLVEKSDMIAVEPMEASHALALFMKKLGQNESDDVMELAAALEYMPLAIVQAAAYITERAPRCSVAHYLEEFRKSDREKTALLDQEAGHLRRDWEARNSIIITWQISFDHVRQTRPSAADLLSLMSFFDRQGIPEALVRDQVETTDSSQSQHSTHTPAINSFEDDLLMLRNYSFISIAKDHVTFEMHALVQLAMRKWLEASGQLERWRQQYIKSLCIEFPSGEYENWTKCQALFPHAKSAVAQQPEAKASLLEWALLLYNAAWYAWRKGNVVEAEQMGLKSMEVRRIVLGEEHKDTLHSMTMVGIAYRMGGKWEQAEELQLQDMKTSKKVLGAEHPDTMASISNLALTYCHQGRWDQAEELQLQVMEMRKRVLGIEHRDTLTSMSNLAVTYRYQGRWGQAEELQLQVMEMRKRVLGIEHPDTLISISNLALTYRYQGRWGQAEELQLQVMDTHKRALGIEHPDTLISMSNLAVTYRYQGRWGQAEELQLQVMEMRKRVLGIEHPDTLTSISNLALTYHDQGRWGQAEELQLQVMETSKRVLGVRHPHVLDSMSNLACTWRLQGRNADALELMHECVKLRIRILGVNHPYTLSSSSLLTQWREEQLEISGNH